MLSFPFLQYEATVGGSASLLKNIPLIPNLREVYICNLLRVKDIDGSTRDIDANTWRILMNGFSFVSNTKLSMLKFQRCIFPELPTMRVYRASFKTIVLNGCYKNSRWDTYEENDEEVKHWCRIIPANVEIELNARILRRR